MSWPWINRNSPQQDMRGNLPDYDEQFEPEDTDYLESIFGVLEIIASILKEQHQLLSGIHEELVRFNQTIDAARRQAKEAQ